MTVVTTQPDIPPRVEAPPVQPHVARVALIGNPNSGKTSLFNQLTGLNQKVGNFPGVTVDKKTGYSQLTPKLKVQMIDLPGTYSLYPKSLDERIIIEREDSRDATNRDSLTAGIAAADTFLFDQAGLRVK